MKQATTTVLYYKGQITFERIGILLNDLKNRKEAFNLPPVLYKKLLAVLIEVLENILKYSDNFEDFVVRQPDYLPEFKLMVDDKGYKIISRNPVRIEDMDTIITKINLVNKSTGEELKEIYRETITNGLFTEKGGAGLGMIELAKITDLNMMYEFHPAESGYNIYELILQINHID